MCEAGADHVVQILWVCGFSVIEHYPRADLLVFVRDCQHFDLGGFIKVQVKNRPILTESPSTDNGRVGWWVRDFTYHDDPFPRLLVLFDENSEEAHWVHVTKDKVLGAEQEQKYLFPGKMLLITSLLILWLQLPSVSCPSRKKILGYLMRISCDMH